MKTSLFASKTFHFIALVLILSVVLFLKASTPIATASRPAYAVVMKSPDLTLGYVQVPRPGDMDPKQLNCTLCEQPCHPGGIWLTVGLARNQLSLSDPLCIRCAAKE